MRYARFAVVLLISFSAQQTFAAEYICSATLNLPGASGTKGTNGSVGMTTYNGPFCTGSMVAIRNFCGLNNTSQSCALGVQLGDAALNTIFSNAQVASGYGREVSFQVAQCKITMLPNCENNFSVFSQ